MAVQTKKETAFAEYFHKLIAASNDSDESKLLRREAFEFFEVNGFPTPHSEDWKYTNVSSVVGGQWSVVSGQWSVVSGRRKGSGIRSQGSRGRSVVN